MKKILLYSILAGTALFFALLAPAQIDFQFFYNAGYHLLHGSSPYLEPGYFNPVWVAVFFAPLALFPFEAAWRIHAFLSIFIYSIAFFRLVRNRKSAWLYAALAPFFIVITSVYGNMEYMVLLGITLPAPIGIFLVLSKPQMGLGVAMVMLLVEWNRSHRSAVTIGMFVILAELLSVLMGMGGYQRVNQTLNMALPSGFLIGVPLLLLALWRRNRLTAMAATMTISPYATALSWVAIIPMVCELVSSFRPTHLRHYRIRYVLNKIQTRSLGRCVIKAPLPEPQEAS